MRKTNGEVIAELAEKYSKSVLAQAGIVALGRFIKETMELPDQLTFALATMAYKKELEESAYLFASLSDEVEECVKPHLGRR